LLPGGDSPWSSARALCALPTSRAPAAISATAMEATALPLFASTASAIEFGTGRGFSIRLNSGSRIRK
jgi:hypothetical protein